MSFTGTLQYEQADPTGLSCMNSAWVMRPSTRSEHRYSGARTGSTSSGRSDTNIIRSRIAPRVRCGRVAGVLPPRSEISVCGRTPSWLARMGSLTFLCLDYSTTEDGPALPEWEQANRRSTSVKNSEPVTNAEPVRGPSCVGSDTFFRKHLAQPRMFLSFRRFSHPQNIIFGQPKSGPSLLI